MLNQNHLIKGELTVRQQLFVHHYLASFNATEAAKRAGYSRKNPRQAGASLMSNSIIVAEIQRRMAVILGKMEISANRVIAEMAQIALSDVGEVVEWGPDGLTLKDSKTLDPSALAGIKSVTERPTKHGMSLSVVLHDKVKALQTLGTWLKIGQPDEGTGARLSTGIPHGEPVLEISSEQSSGQ